MTVGIRRELPDAANSSIPDTTHRTWHQQSGTAARKVVCGEWATGVIAAPKGARQDLGLT